MHSFARRHWVSLLGSLAGFLLYLFVVSVWGHKAAANEPNKSSDKAAREVVGSGWFGIETPASATAFTCFTMADTVSAALFPWYATTQISCTDRAVACWLQDTAAISIDADGVLTDSSAVSGNGADGRGPCWEQAAGIPQVRRNTPTVFRTPGAVGRRSGACVVSGAATGYPCDATADCPSGTCDVSADRFGWTTGAYLCVTSISGSAISCSANTEAE